MATDAVTTAYQATHGRENITSKVVVFLFRLGGLKFSAFRVSQAINVRVFEGDSK